MKYSLLFILLIFLIAGCQQSFLEEINQSSLSINNYFENKTQAESAVNGIYTSLYVFTKSPRAGEIVFASLEMPVGHSTTSIVYNNDMINQRSAAFDPIFKEIWVEFFRGIANANIAIQKIPSVDMEDDLKNRLMGECYFLRGLFYFYLVRLYGDLPIITDILDYTSQDLYASRSNVKDVYDLIINDLNIAKESKMPLRDNSGRASVGAAKALLSTVYLTMAGEPLNLGNEYYTLAANEAKDLIDGNLFDLFDRYDFLHDREHKNQDEFIFQVQYLAGIQSSGVTLFITPSATNFSSLGRGWGSIIVRKEFIASYESNDKRISEKGFYFTKHERFDRPDIFEEFNEYALYKYWLDEAAGINGDNIEDQNWTIMRYPEILLNYTEAINEVAGPTKDGIDAINLIRERAGISLLDYSITKDELRKAVWRERYHELSFENKAYFDIQRTHRVFNLSDGSFEKVLEYTNESGVQFKKQYLLWPIPQSEIDVNPNISQNPEW